jgi:NADH:ubiquinone oxidoreductase subunit E
MSAMTSSLARTTTAEDPIGDAVLVSVDEVLERYRYDRTALIAILLDVQDILGYLPVIALKRIGSSLDVPATSVDRLHGHGLPRARCRAGDEGV